MIHRHIAFALLCALLGACGKKTITDGTAAISYQDGEAGQAAVTVVASPDADPDALLFKWQGYHHAASRFIQMDMARRMTQARLSELFGEKALSGDQVATDLNFWSIGLPLAVERSLERLEDFPEEKAWLEAYAEGVNLYLGEVAVKDPELLNFYRKLTHNPNYDLALEGRWSPKDSVAIGVQLAYMLSGSLEKKAMLGSIHFAVVDPENGYFDFEKMKILLDLRPVENVSILPAPKARAEEPTFRRSKEILRRFFGFAYTCDPDVRGLSGAFGCGGFNTPGSNNWAVSATHAGGKKTFLSNDPHLMLTFPSSFTEVALDSKKAGGSVKVRGLIPPGIPGVLIGHNENIAWGFTNSMSDVDDLYVESFVHEDPYTVRFKGKKRAIEKVSRVFKVRKADGSLAEVPKELRVVPWHGPVLTDHMSQFKKIKEGLDFDISYKWTGHAGSTEMVAIFGLNRASNYAEFKQALGHFEVGAQNIVYADPDGNIGYYSHGRFPKRPYLEGILPANTVVPPYLPSEGDEGKMEWDGWRTNFPELYNPPKGYIATANNDPYGYNQSPYFSSYKDYFGFRFDPGSRIRRIEDLLSEYKEDGELDLDDMLKIQGDQHDLLACRFMTVLDKHLSELTLSESAERFAGELSQWREKDNCDASKDHKEVVAYVLWLKQLQKKYYAWLKEDVDDMLEEVDPEDRENLLANFYSSPFAVQTVFHKVNEGEPKFVQDLLAESLEAAALERAKRNLETVAWGSVHPVRFINFLSDLLPSPPYPNIERGGTLTTVDMGGFQAVHEFLAESDEPMDLPNVWGPAFRLTMVLEKGKPIEAYNVIPGGAGNNLSKASAIAELFSWRDRDQKRSLVNFAD